MPRSGHLQIRCRLFAALPISLDVVRDLHALREAIHTRSLNSADVVEHILATLIRMNKPVALGFVEPFHSPSSHVESPLRLLRTGSMTRFGWGLPRTHKPVISLSASSRNCRPKREIKVALGVSLSRIASASLVPYDHGAAAVL